MIYDLVRRYAFVHLPRCAGTSISLALSPYATPGTCWDMAHRRHLPAIVMKEMIGPAWKTMFRFTVVRPFDDMVRSFSRYVKEHRLLLKRKETLVPGWALLIIRTLEMEDPYDIWTAAKMPPTEEEFFRVFLCGPSGEDLGVERIDLCRLDEEWPRICSTIAIVPPPPLNRLNGTMKK